MLQMQKTFSQYHLLLHPLLGILQSPQILTEIKTRNSEKVVFLENNLKAHLFRNENLTAR